MKDEVVGLRGGQKTMWLRIHRAEVLEYYYKHGGLETQHEYGIGYLALEGLLRAAVAPPEVPEGSPVPAVDYTPVFERIDMRINTMEAGFAEVRGRQRRLEEAYMEFKGSVTQGVLDRLGAVLMDGLARAYKVPARLEGSDQDDETEVKGAG